jgi:hypothetical protein
MTPAAKLQKYLRQRVEQTGGVYRKARWEGRRGCPDCYCWWPGGTYAWVEVKVGRDALSTLQSRETARMGASGLAVFVAKCQEDVDDILARLNVGGGNA